MWATRDMDSVLNLSELVGNNVLVIDERKDKHSIKLTTKYLLSALITGLRPSIFQRGNPIKRKTRFE